MLRRGFASRWSLALAALAMIACGGSAVTDGSGGSGSGGSGGTGGTKPVGACIGSSTQSSCKTCCDAKNPGGNDRLLGLLAACLCTSNVCLSACTASICAEPPAALDGPCSACESAASKDPGSCVGSVNSQCNADAKCQPYTACIGDSKCLDKP